MAPHPRTKRPRHQRGAALLTAMIIVVLIVTLASSMVWQQWRAVQVEVAERARSQSAWILSGALDWARLILREDARGTAVDHLGEPWAVPLAEARLSTFLAADKNNTDDGPEAFLSGSITDAQSRYNVTNLVDQAKGIVDPLEFAAFERLCQNLGVDSSVASLVASGLRDALAPAGSGSNANAPLLPQSVAQLSWLGVDAASLELLAPYIVVLPVATEVNVNTASAEVLVAVIKGNDHATAERLLQVRQRTPFEDMAKFAAQVPSLAPLAARPLLSVKSDFFEVRGRLRLSDRVLEETSLLRRVQGRQIDVLRRERVASREDNPPAN